MKLKYGVLSILLLFLGPACFAGPFGFNAGTTRKELINTLGPGAVVEQVHSTMGYSLTFNTAPTKSDYFDKYLCSFDQNDQLEGVTAMSRPIKTMTGGEDLRDEFDRLKSALEEKYGKALVVTGSRASGTKWQDRLGDDFASAIWSAESPQLKNSHIDRIVLSIDAATKDYGFFELEYDFDNWKNAF